VHCWKIENDDIEEDYPRGIYIKETKGEHVVEGKVVETVALEYGHLIKIKKHNIHTGEAPKMAIIGDYWDKETVT